MLALKGVVIGMGVLIVIGMGLLVYGVTAGFGSLGGGGERTSATSAKGFGTVRARLPAGATIVQSTHDGDRLSVRLSLPDGGARIMIFHLGDGRQIGTIELESGR
jgi:hypothetical protein